MKKLEIIEIQSVATSRAVLEAHMLELFEQVRNDQDEIDVTIFKNGLIDTNYSIHLLQECESVVLNKSSTGKQLAAALKEHGIVSHSIWIQRC